MHLSNHLTHHVTVPRYLPIVCSSALMLLALMLLPEPPAAAAEQPLLKLRPVPFKDVTIQDSFWAPRRETNRVARSPSTSRSSKAGQPQECGWPPAGHQRLPRAGLHGFRRLQGPRSRLLLAGDPPRPGPGEAARRHHRLLAAAQQPDGYLDSYYIVKEPGHRWTNLRDNHELYCAGHMIEAAVAHYQATGKTNFLNVATSWRTTSTRSSAAGKRLGYPGHPEIELALVKLWRATGKRRYFDLARFFIENRGRKYFATEHHTPLDQYDGTYWQDDVPISDHRNIKGHAVRAAYLLSGATDVAAQTGDERLLKMLDRVWRNTTERNEYITGGIGPSAHNEGFTEDYDLPNLTAYQETCASVALAQWNHRLALLYGDARYADVFERSLYNGVLSGVSLDGTKFFYVNPLESAGTHHRVPLVRLRLLPAQRHAHARRAGRLRLRRQRRLALGQPLHPGLGPGQGRRHRRHAQGHDRLPVGRQGALELTRPRPPNSPCGCACPAGARTPRSSVNRQRCQR